MLATRGRSASLTSVQVGVSFQHLPPSSRTGILHQTFSVPVAWNPRIQCRSVLRSEGEVRERWLKRNWQAQIRPSDTTGSSRFLHLGSASERPWVATAPDVCRSSNNCNIPHRSLEFGKQGKNYKATRCMDVNSDDRSSVQESHCSVLQSKHKIFLSHSGKQKEFVKDLCAELEARFRFPFFDIHPSSLRKGEPFPNYIFQAAKECEMAVVLVSEEYFTSKWPMIELNTFVQARFGSNPRMKILPLFFGLSVSEFCDPLRRERWFKLWEGWAKKDDRINPMDFSKALKEMGSCNGFEFSQDMKEVRTFRRNVVSSICDVISPNVKWDDSHVQGRLNICEVVREKIQSIQPSKDYVIGMTPILPMESKHKVCVIGFYGMGGIGKTTMCKILCNELSEFEGKVCHVELTANKSLEELLKEVLKKLTSISEMLLQQLNEGECKHILRNNMSFQQKTFLAVDNVWDDSKSIEQAKMFLEAAFHEGSVVLVTARSQSTLAFLGIDECNCFEVPALGKVDARNLFLYHAAKGKQFVSEEDNHIIDECLGRCYFQKSEKQGSHYIPLALKILGLHLGCHGNNPSDWLKSLPKVRDFNSFSEENPVFSIIRVNFDRLLAQEQAIFMDIALYWPKRKYLSGRRETMEVIGLIEWLNLVHRQKLEDTESQLHRLKEKGLLEDVDLISQEVSMHDLYREFAEMESEGKLNSASFSSRRWVYAYSYPTELEMTPAGRCWESLIRVGIHEKFTHDDSISSLDGIQWRYCSNVMVLNLIELSHLKGVLNLKDLRCLRSLELEDLQELDGVEGLGDLNSLTYFYWKGNRYRSHDVPRTYLGPLSASLKVLQVTGADVYLGRDVLARCANLGKLVLECIRAGDGMDFSQCTSLRSVTLSIITGLKKLLGLAAGLKYCLQSLYIRHCNDLCDVSGLDQLVGLQVLKLLSNDVLEKLPDLQKLTSLQVLQISGASIAEVPGLGSLQQLRDLVCNISDLPELPNLSGLQQLHRLNLMSCNKLTTLEGVGDLPALRQLELGFCRSLQRLPDLSKLTNLEDLELRSCGKLTTLEGVGDLPALRRLDLHECKSLVRLPDLSNSTHLEQLDISNSGIELRQEDIHMLAKLPLLQPVRLSWYLRLDAARRKVLICWTDGTVEMERDFETLPIKSSEYRTEIELIHQEENNCV